MIKSLELKGPSCLTSARDDEPIFVLRSNDELAPLVVRFWATQYFKLKMKQPGGMTPKQRAKQAEALQLANMMPVWRAKNAKSLVEGMAGHPVASIDAVIVDGQTLAIESQGVLDEPIEPQRIGDEVLSGCAVRAAQQIERHEARESVRMPQSSEEAELMVRLGTQWLEANDPGRLVQRAGAMLTVCRLASELCNSIDAAEADIGGNRPAAEILAELGPACDAYEGR
jgi:hypothetical protein